MPFLQQFAMAYGAALVIGSFAMTRGNGFTTLLSIYGLFGLPFAAAIAGIARLLEKTPLGWTAGIVSTLGVIAVLYVVAPNKQNFLAGIGLVAPFALLFAAIWSFLTWRHLGSA